MLRSLALRLQLADNKLTDRSSWDDRKVAIVLKELSDIALDFEIGATGFEPPEIDLRIQSLDPPDESTDTADDFEAPEGPPVSRSDDLWTLGDHRLLCGSALDSHAYGALLGGEKAAAAFLIFLAITAEPLEISAPHLVRWLSGRKRRFAKALYPLKGTQGSNPCLTALFL